MSLSGKKIFKFLKYVLFFTFFIICLSPALLVKLTTGGLDKELDDFYFERRAQAMALFAGIVLISIGLEAVKRREILWKSRLFRDKYDSDLEITGKYAFFSGITLILLGIFATVWSLFFWVKYVFPVIF